MVRDRLAGQIVRGQAQGRHALAQLACQPVPDPGGPPATQHGRYRAENPPVGLDHPRRTALAVQLRQQRVEPHPVEAEARPNRLHYKVCHLQQHGGHGWQENRGFFPGPSASERPHKIR